jgi:non-specific serine/threonine protein kinase
MAKRILKHALSGLAFLHENGVVHGDFQPGNLLFSIRGDLNSVDEGKLGQNKANITKPIERLDGKVDKWAPKYLIISESLHEYADLTPDLEIKISDLGAGKNPLYNGEILLTIIEHSGQLIHRNRQ